jgi:chorismate-pyruvate lyase
MADSFSKFDSLPNGLWRRRYAIHSHSRLRNNGQLTKLENLMLYLLLLTGSIPRDLTQTTTAVDVDSLTANVLHLSEQTENQLLVTPENR